MGEPTDLLGEPGPGTGNPKRIVLRLRADPGKPEAKAQAQAKDKAEAGAKAEVAPGQN